MRPAQHLHFLSYPVAYECQGISEGGNVQGSMSVPRRRPTGIFNRDRWTSVDIGGDGGASSCGILRH